MSNLCVKIGKFVEIKSLIFEKQIKIIKSINLNSEVKIMRKKPQFWDRNQNLVKKNQNFEKTSNSLEKSCNNEIKSQHFGCKKSRL